MSGSPEVEAYLTRDPQDPVLGLFLETSYNALLSIGREQVPFFWCEVLAITAAIHDTASLSNHRPTPAEISSLVTGIVHALVREPEFPTEEDSNLDATIEQSFGFLVGMELIDEENLTLTEKGRQRFESDQERCEKAVESRRSRENR